MTRSNLDPNFNISTKYRADIDGLRCLAVIAVLLFHAFPNYFHAGFVGVDIFFAILGYLITGIILDEMSRSTFKHLVFYAKRIRRIFPALILVLMTSFGLGYVFMMSDEFVQ